jgi:hypothetical protein
VCNDLSWRARSRWRISCLWSKSSSLMVDDTVDTLVSSLFSSPSSWLVFSSWLIIEVLDRSYWQYATLTQIIGRQTIDEQCR